MSEEPQKSSQPTWRLQHYEIVVRGPVGPTVLEAFPTLTPKRHGHDTILGGPLPDQSALYGVLHQLEALGIELLEVRRPAIAPQ